MRKWNGAPTVSRAADVNSSFERSRHSPSTTPWGGLQIQRDSTDTRHQQRENGHDVDYLVVERLFEPEGDMRAEI